MADRSVMVRLRADAGPFSREMLKARAAVKGLRDEIDTTNDRTAWLTQGLLAIGPTLAPLGAAIVPVLSGIATQATLAVGAVGTMALAFNGVGDALSALNKFQLEPTAENLAAMRQAMAKIGPEGAEFVRFLDEIGEQLSVLQMDARGGMFPGMTEGIERAMALLPQMRVIVTEIAEAIGQLSIDAGGGIAGPEFEAFFDYLETDAKPLLVEMGRTLGNFVDGFASLIVAFGPLTRDFSGGLLEMSRSFEQWAEGLSNSDSFAEFLDYVRQSAPKALDLLAALTDLVVELAKAAAPIGDVILPVLSNLFRAIASVADTPVGQLAILGAALTSLYGRLAALRSIAGGPIFGTLTKGIRDSARETGTASRSIGRDVGQIAAVWATAGTRTEREERRMREATKSLRGNLTGVARDAAPAAAQLGLFAAAMSPLPEKLGLTNTAMGAMIGLIGGGWGAALGATVGLFLDMEGAADRAAESQERINAAFKSTDPTVLADGLREAQAELEKWESSRADGVDGWLRRTFDDEDAKRQIDEAANAVARVKAQMLNTTVAKRKLDAAMADNQALIAAREAARESAEGFYSLGDAIEKPKLTLEKLMDQMQRMADAAANLASNWGEALRNGADPEALQQLFDQMGPQAALVFEQLANGGKKAAREFNKLWGAVESGEHALAGVIERGNQINNRPIKPKFDTGPMRIAEDKARDVAGELEYVSNIRATPRIDVKSNAQQQAAATEGWLNGIGDEQVWINVTRRITATSLGPREESADGGFVPKTGLPYADRHPYLLADGEGVTTNRRGETDRFRDVISGINAGFSRSQVKGMLADGRPTFGSAAQFFGPNFRPLDAAFAAAAAAAGEFAGATFEAAELEDDSVKKRKRALEQQLKLQEKELASIQERLEAEKAYREEIKNSIVQLVQGSADIWGTVRTPVIPGIGSDGEITWEDGPATFGSASSQLQFQIKNAAELSDLIEKLRRKGFTGPALAALLQSASIETIRDFANQSRSELAAFAADYQAVQQATNQLGNQAAAAEGVTGEIRKLRKQFHEAQQESRALRRALNALHETEKRAPRETGKFVGQALNNAANKAVLGARGGG